MNWLTNWLINRALHIRTASAVKIDKMLNLKPGTTAAVDDVAANLAAAQVANAAAPLLTKVQTALSADTAPSTTTTSN